MRGRFDAARARDALAPLGIEPPPLRTYFQRLIAFAPRAEWGHRPVARHEAVAPNDPRERPAAR